MIDQAAESARLNAEFGRPGVRFEPGAGGLARVVLSAAGGEAHVYLHGAHVTHFRRLGVPGPVAEPVLFMSKRSWFKPGKPIRGGVPVIFPWFGGRAGGPTAGSVGTGAADSPNHGFARLKPWRVDAVGARSAGRVALALVLMSDGMTQAAWPFAFVARFRVIVGATLAMTLKVRNTGERPFVFEEALHTYLEVGDVRRASVTGLAGAEYLDKAAGGERKTQADPLTIAAETDRVYLDTAAACELRDLSLNRRIRLSKTGSRTTVVWNPWVGKAKKMPDFGNDEWPRMLCIESGNAGERAVRLEPGEAHTMSAQIAVEALGTEDAL